MEVGTGEKMLAANLCLREHLPGNLDVTPVLGSSALWDLPSQIPCLSLSYPLWVLKATPEVFILGVACLSPTRSSSSEKKKNKNDEIPLGTKPAGTNPQSSTRTGFPNPGPGNWALGL